MKTKKIPALFFINNNLCKYDVLKIATDLFFLHLQFFRDF